ncbi:MAG: hypothetical protein EOP48_08230 [Sphingobacteriales bacterium]|nr:MAG: hypothetical protein EOP48_08230 [Sphingobacteriales bacterium]
MKQQEFDFLNYTGLAYALFGVFIVVICIGFNKKIIQTKANLVLRFFEVLSLGAILAYALYQKWYLPAGYSTAALLGILLAFYWEKTGKQNRIASFTDDGVHIPGLGKKSEAAWQDIKRIILKHNILTVDFKDNKLYQLQLATQKEKLNQEEFETYCHFQIEAKKHLHKQDW